MYRELLEGVPPCDKCPGGLLCSQPLGLTRDGMAVARAEGPDLVVSWPACPRQYEKGRVLGGEVVSLATVVRWAIDRGVHRMAHPPPWSSRLMRHWLRSHETPGALRMARRQKQKEMDDLALGATS